MMNAHASDWRNAPSHTKYLAFLALSAIVGGVALTTMFSAAAARAVGPTLIARNSAGEILLANLDTLFLIPADESRTAELSTQGLGLQGRVMSLSSDGKDWFLGDDATGMLYRCDLSVRHCAAALRSEGGRRVFRRAHHVAFTADHIFMTDSESHRLRTFNREGHALENTRTQPLALCFPNGIVTVDGTVYVADTNNFRIASMSAGSIRESATYLRTNAGAALERPNCNDTSSALSERGDPVINTALDSASSVARKARPPARADRAWPTSVLRTRSGEWWVIQMANGMRMGDVIRYDSAGQALGRVELPADADPIELVEAGDSVLITDGSLTRVHRVSAAGVLTGEWGPPDFRASLSAIAIDREHKQMLQRMSVGVIVVGVLAAVLVIGFELRRAREQKWTAAGTLQPVTVAPGTLGQEPTWIALDADVIRRMRQAFWMLAAFLLCVAAVLGYLVHDLSREPVAHGLLVLFIVPLAVYVWVLWRAHRFLERSPRCRIGVSRSEVRFESGSGSVITSSWEDLRIGPRALLIGNQVVEILDHRGRYRFPQQQIEAQLLGHLPASAFLNHWRMMLDALRRGNAAWWTFVVAVFLYLLLLALKVSHPELIRGLGTRMGEWLR
jgi:hypothetical protein